MDTNDTSIIDSATTLGFSDASGTGAMLFDRTLLPQIDPSLFDPANPAIAAQPVIVGGRGAAWFVRNAAGEAVLRHYRRGGMVARFSRQTYLWQGSERTRSFREFRLLGALCALKLPVPAPLAAIYWRCGTGYRAALLMQRLSETQSIGGLLDRAEAVPWPELGRTLAQFHRVGACHADLNVDNVLMDAQQKLWLIDFDRGTLQARARGWQQANIARLRRSLRKRLGARANSTAIVAGWDAMLAAYRDSMGEAA